MHGLAEFGVRGRAQAHLEGGVCHDSGSIHAKVALRCVAGSRCRGQDQSWDGGRGCILSCARGRQEQGGEAVGGGQPHTKDGQDWIHGVPGGQHPWLDICNGGELEGGSEKGKSGKKRKRGA